MDGDDGRSLQGGGDVDVSFDPREPQNSENDSKERKKLRRKYRELIDTVLSEYLTGHVLPLNTKDCPC